MSKVEKILEGAYNSLSTFNGQLNQLSLDLVYGKGDAPTEMLQVDFFSRENRGQVIKAFQNIKANPSLENIYQTLEIINTYDLCNPLQFAAGQLFPPGSPVANSLGRVQGKINEVVNKFRAFSFIGGVKEVIAEAVPDPLSEAEVGAIPFKIGKIVLAVP
jgi:hypothetical protein